MLDGFPQRDFVLWVFMCPTNVTLFCVFYFVSIFSLPGYHAKGYHAPSLPPRAITPVYTSRLSRHSIFLLLGYHTRAIMLHHTRTSGYHTRHSSSFFVVYLSPAITPPVLLHLQPPPGRHTYQPAPHASVLDRTSGPCVAERNEEK